MQRVYAKCGRPWSSRIETILKDTQFGNDTSVDATVTLILSIEFRSVRWIYFLRECLLTDFIID